MSFAIKIGRRNLFREGSLLTTFGLLSSRRASALPAAAASNPYAAVGVRTLINCKGTLTWVGGSQTLPEVKKAMEDASRHYVHLVELMDAVGKRIAEMAGAEFAIVTSGCTAALSLGTAAAIAGADPEKIQRIPDLAGMKSEVLMPRSSRNVFDHAMRSVGARIIEFETREQYLRAFSDKTALVSVTAGHGTDTAPVPLEEVYSIAREKGVPTLVDAAAEELRVPNIHLKAGATMVAYSGGKCLRGPQCAGLLLGPRALVWSAFVNGAPHHGFGRSMKVGKEEIMGMLAAVEAWKKRDHEQEWKTWQGWLEEIASRVSRIPGVNTEFVQPRDLSNRQPMLRVSWDAAQLGVAGDEVERRLYDGEPRIAMVGSAGTPARPQSSVLIYPYVMIPGDAPTVAARLHQVLSSAAPRKPAAAAVPERVAGQWDVRVEFLQGSADHKLTLQQDGDRLTGTHRGTFNSGELRGSVSGATITIRSTMRYEGTPLIYEFEGKLENGQMTGTVVLGGAAPREYGPARFTARRA